MASVRISTDGGSGLHGLRYQDVLRYFKKSEHQRRTNEYHTLDGPLWVSDLPSKHELADAFISTERTGSPANNDFNGETQEGLAMCRSRRGKASLEHCCRLSETAECEDSVKIRTGAGQASWLKQARHRRRIRGRSRTYNAQREVIVCGGRSIRRNSCNSRASVQPTSSRG